MATTNSNITTEANQPQKKMGRETIDEALMNLGRINGVLDCLFTLASDDLNCGMDLGLTRGALHQTLDALLHQVEETQNLLEGV